MTAPGAAIVTVVTDDFVPAFVVFLSTVLEHNPWLEEPWLVLTPDNGLSAANADLLRRRYPSLRIVEGSPPSLAHLQAQGRAALDTPQHLVAAFLILEAFRFTEFDRVLCLDADMLCLGDISELLHPADGHDGFAAVRAASRRGQQPLPFFNSGVFRVGRRYLGGATYHDLTARTRLADARPHTGKADQAVLNLYFYPYRVRWLPIRYNSTKRMFPDRLESVEGEIERWDVRFLHYVGSKPWTRPRTANDRRLTKVEGLWHQAARRYLPDEQMAALVANRFSSAVPPT